MNVFRIILILSLLFPNFLLGQFNRKDYYSLTSTHLSNIKLAINNYGIIGHDFEYQKAFMFWPASSFNQYLFGGGFIITAQKRVDGKLKNLVEFSYDVNSAYSAMAPGIYSEGYKAAKDAQYKYPSFTSYDFNKETGQKEPFSSEPAWPLWTVPGGNAFDSFGIFVENKEQRNLGNYPAGPLFVSEEDFFCIYKDSDLRFYDKDNSELEEKGYPAGFEFQQSVYTWSNPQYRDGIIIRYTIINRSDDTLYNCRFNPAFDPDLTSIPFKGASNDYCQIVNSQFRSNDIQYPVFWTGIDDNEAGNEFGYMAVSVLLSPIVNNNGFVENDLNILDYSKQSRISGIKQIPLEMNIYDEYQVLNLVEGIGNSILEGPGDQRVLLASHAFNLAPDDRAYFAVAISMTETLDKVQPAELNEKDSLEVVKNMSAFYELFYDDIFTDIDITEKFKPNTVEVYPNPANIELNVSLPKEFISQKTIFNIHNLNGELVKRVTSFNQNNIIDVSELCSGTYLLHIDSKGEQFHSLITIFR